MKNLRKLVVLSLIGFSSNSCYVEHDSGLRTPRRDPCTGIVEVNLVYVHPTCPLPQPSPPPPTK